MIKNSKCDTCKLGKICKVKSKLKCFTDEAKVDLGVKLTFDECANFVKYEDDELDETEEDEEE